VFIACGRFAFYAWQQMGIAFWEQGKGCSRASSTGRGSNIKGIRAQNQKNCIKSESAGISAHQAPHGVAGAFMSVLLLVSVVLMAMVIRTYHVELAEQLLAMEGTRARTEEELPEKLPLEAAGMTIKAVCPDLMTGKTLTAPEDLRR